MHTCIHACTEAEGSRRGRRCVNRAVCFAYALNGLSSKGQVMNSGCALLCLPHQAAVPAYWIEEKDECNGADFPISGILFQ